MAAMTAAGPCPAPVHPIPEPMNQTALFKTIEDIGNRSPTQSDACHRLLNGRDIAV
jgi:hypothetical protein